MARKLKPRIVAITLILAVMVLAVGTLPNGYLAVRTACKKDGGLRINETVFVPGYFYKGHANRCLTCEEDVLSERFDYVDANIRWTHPLTDKKGLYRYSLATQGAPACKRWAESKEYASLRKKYASQTKCLVLLPIENPSPYVYEYRRIGVDGSFGTQLSLTELKISNVETSTTLATYRRYGYVSWLDDLLYEKPAYRWQCELPKYKNILNWFRTDVLRDPSKR